MSFRAISDFDSNGKEDRGGGREVQCECSTPGALRKAICRAAAWIQVVGSCSILSRVLRPLLLWLQNSSWNTSLKVYLDEIPPLHQGHTLYMIRKESLGIDIVSTAHERSVEANGRAERKCDFLGSLVHASASE